MSRSPSPDPSPPAANAINVNELRTAVNRNQDLLSKFQQQRPGNATPRPRVRSHADILEISRLKKELDHAKQELGEKTAEINELLEKLRRAREEIVEAERLKNEAEERKWELEYERDDAQEEVDILTKRLMASVIPGSKESGQIFLGTHTPSKSAREAHLEEEVERLRDELKQSELGKRRRKSELGQASSA